jgi:LPXTG-site transpeptidase (sortase) family protein
MAGNRLVLMQRLSLGIGVLLIAVWAGAWLHKTLGRQNDLEAFEAARRAASTPAIVVLSPREQAELEVEVAAVEIPEPEPVLVPLPETGPPDTTLWAAGRVTDYETSVVVDKRVPQALLRIPAIDLAVPLLEGIDEITLNRGVGRIPGMARKIADGGNFGIAGHRDGYFRGLKDIGVGDTIEVLTLTDTFSYRVDDISIIGKNDLSVLQPTDNQVLTLVTCYPFYFVGHAPKRYIVKAVLEQQDTRT